MTKSLHRVGPVDAVVFDCDGTLVDSESVWLDTVADIIARQGVVPGSLEDFRGITAESAAIKIADIAKYAPAEAHSLLNREYSKNLSVVDNPIPGVRDFVATLSRFMPVAVASNGRRDDVAALMNATGLEPFLSALLTVEDVRKGKPAPDIYLAAVERLHVPAHRVVVFEDSPIGARAALTAGCMVVGVGSAINLESKVSVSALSFGDVSFDPESAMIIVSS